MQTPRIAPDPKVNVRALLKIDAQAVAFQQANTLKLSSRLP